MGKRNAKNLIQWFWSEHRLLLINHHADGICQCSTEGFIASSKHPSLMRAFLVIGVFLDQMLPMLFQNIYPEFQKNFKFPILYSHPDPGATVRPEWFLSELRENRDKFKWNIASSVTRTLLLGILDWMSKLPNGDAIIRRFLCEMKNQLINSFEPKDAYKFHILMKKAATKYFEQNYERILLGELLLFLSKMDGGDVITKDFLTETENRIDRDFEYNDIKKLHVLLERATDSYLKRVWRLM